MISVIYSFRNEQENLKELIERTIKIISSIQINYEIIFVDDYSDDKSRDIILNYASSNNNIKYIGMEYNCGIAQSIICGLKNCKGDYAVYLDSDLQDPPELIEKMYKKILEGNNVINTIRTKRKKESKVKLFLTNVAYNYLNKNLKPAILKNSGDFKMFDKKALQIFLGLSEKDPFLRGIPSKIGLKQSNIFYERDGRYKGNTKFPIFASLNPYKEIFRAITTHKNNIIYYPFLLALLLGTVIIGMVLLKLIGIDISWVNIFICIILLSIQFSISIACIFLDRINTNSNSSEEYRVKEKVNFD